jgi:Fur family ferric uptake transcriptional regulator
MLSQIEKKCADKGFRMTGARKVIVEVISESNDHPTVEEIFERAKKKTSKASIATVYRTLKILEEVGVVDKHDFGEGFARYEKISEEHHDHLINIKTGKVIEFSSPEIEQLQKKIAQEYGFELVDHRMELYGKPISKK